MECFFFGRKLVSPHGCKEHTQAVFNDLCAAKYECLLLQLILAGGAGIEQARAVIHEREVILEILR